MDTVKSGNNLSQLSGSEKTVDSQLQQAFTYYVLIGAVRKDRIKKISYRFQC